MQPKSSNLLRLGTRLGTKVSSILLLNLLSSVLLLSLVGRGLIVGGRYIGAVGWAIGPLELDSNLLI